MGTGHCDLFGGNNSPQLDEALVFAGLVLTAPVLLRSVLAHPGGHVEMTVVLLRRVPALGLYRSGHP